MDVDAVLFGVTAIVSASQGANDDGIEPTDEDDIGGIDSGLRDNKDAGSDTCIDTTPFADANVRMNICETKHVPYGVGKCKQDTNAEDILPTMCSTVASLLLKKTITISYKYYLVSIASCMRIGKKCGWRRWS